MLPKIEYPDLSKSVLALLAAGQSRRFGAQDKLCALLHGNMLGIYSAESLASLPFTHRFVVAASADHPCAARWQELGYKIIINPDAASGQSTSTILAAKAALDCGADNLCIALADMPFVTAAHVKKLFAKFDGAGGTGIIASSNGKNAMPPAIFPKPMLEKLTCISGDKGARVFLKDAEKIEVTDGILMDIDTPAALAAANAKKP